MLFADDCYLYCKTTSDSSMHMLNLLQTFEKISGQKVNYMKSSIFFSTNVTAAVRENICQLLQMVEADDKSTYMGLSNMLGRNKSETLGFIKDKMNQCMQR